MDSSLRSVNGWPLSLLYLIQSHLQELITYRRLQSLMRRIEAATSSAETAPVRRCPSLPRAAGIYKRLLSRHANTTFLGACLCHSRQLKQAGTQCHNYCSYTKVSGDGTELRNYLVRDETSLSKRREATGFREKIE